VLRNFYALEPHELTADKCREIVTEISSIFADVWAKFNLGSMLIGALFLLETLLWNASLIFRRTLTISGRAAMSKILQIFLGLVWLLAKSDTLVPAIGLITCILIVLHFSSIFNHFTTIGCQALYNDICFCTVIVFLVVFVHGIGNFSNSFIVHDDMVSRFCVSTVIVAIFVNNALMSDKNQSVNLSNAPRPKKKRLTLARILKERFGLTPTIYVFMCLLLVRIGVWFSRCREEQTNCLASLFTVNFASLLDQHDKMLRVLLAIFSLAALSAIPRLFLIRNKHFESNSFLSLMFQFATVLFPVFVSIIWYCDDIASIGHNLKVVFDFGQAKNICLLLHFLAIVLLTVFWMKNPVLAYVEQFVTVDNQILTNSRQAFNYLRQNWHKVGKEYGSSSDKPGLQLEVNVFGLATAFSGSILALLTVIMWFFVTILGDGLSLSLICQFLLILLSLEICLTRHGDESSKRHCLVTVLFSELTNHAFYALGHQTTFASIPWDAAFVGNPLESVFGLTHIGPIDWKMTQKAILVILHLSAGSILVVSCIPLVPIWHHYKSKLGRFSLTKTSPDNAETGSPTEANHLSEKGAEKFMEQLFWCDLTLLVLQAWKLACAVLASALHRRHLMVWKIFAPKFIFDGILFIVSATLLIVQYLFCMRLCTCLLNFMKHIKQKFA